MEYRAYKYRLYPNEEQKALIAKHLGSCRFIYNYALDKKVRAYQTDKTNLSRFDIQADGYYYLYTPISFTIAEYIQISFITSLFLLILSISLRFCWRHQIGIVYLLILCVQRNFNDVLFTSNSAFLTICYTNIAVILVILFLGVQQFIRTLK